MAALGYSLDILSAKMLDHARLDTYLKINRNFLLKKLKNL